MKKKPNTRNKMYIANSATRKWLEENKFKNIHFFPHTRWSKDVHFMGLEFDGCAEYEDKFFLFQVKTNCKPTKRQQEKMFNMYNKSKVMSLWFNKVKGKSEPEIYSSLSGSINLNSKGEYR